MKKLIGEQLDTFVLLHVQLNYFYIQMMSSGVILKQDIKEGFWLFVRCVPASHK